MDTSFETKNIKPMLIGELQEAFNSFDYIYELKLDGHRCIAYLDKDSTDLRNKRDIKLISKVPELINIHKQVNQRCILDGELIVIKDGKPDFYEIQRRSLMSNTFKIQLAAAKLPATFTAFDILYYKNRTVKDLPLMERKKLLAKVINENQRIAVSRFIEEKGIELYNLAMKSQLEGVVAKRKDSKYYYGKRTKEWIKFKYHKDDDYVVCGYIFKRDSGISIIIGQYSEGNLVHSGYVSLGLTSKDFQLIKATNKIDTHPFDVSMSENNNVVWVEPILVCIVRFMMKTSNGSLRQPVFKGLRDDKSAEECTVN